MDEPESPEAEPDGPATHAQEAAYDAAPELIE